jgi:hypothetical protein
MEEDKSSGIDAERVFSGLPHSMLECFVCPISLVFIILVAILPRYASP